MKKLILTVILVVSSLFLQAQESTGITITVVLENVLNDEGNILAALHTQETFMKGEGVASFADSSQSGEMSFQFENVRPGTYAVSVMQDLNKNFQMDREPNGMPSEPYAFSGNDMTMGPPVFSAVKFEVAEEDLELRLRF